jgi:CRISP-associated protein Cas1
LPLDNYAENRGGNYRLEKLIPRSEKEAGNEIGLCRAVSPRRKSARKLFPNLRALEANCAASNLRSWAGIPFKWRGISRRPIPNWHLIGVRSSPSHLAGNRNAARLVNAILNYAYAALESEIRIKAISDGYDPTIGKAATDRRNPFLI